MRKELQGAGRGRLGKLLLKRGRAWGKTGPAFLGWPCDGMSQSYDRYSIPILIIALGHTKKTQLWGKKRNDLWTECNG